MTGEGRCAGGADVLQNRMGRNDRLSEPDIAQARERRLVAMHLQRIEGNPLSPDQIQMFEMFEREGWSHERRLAYILESVRALAAE